MGSNRFLVAAALLLAATPSFAGKDDPVPVTVRVMDPDGNPIAGATIRHPEEKTRHAVNGTTGEWTESVLYLDSGKEISFVKDFELQLEISASGYINQNIRYLVRKRRNLIPVMLMRMEMEADSGDDIQVQFKRDRPID